MKIMKKVESIFYFVLKIQIVAFILFFSLEVTFRIYDHFFPSMIFPKTGYNRFRPPPGYLDYDFNLNSHGFKDIEYSLKKPEDTYRIIAIGDSFAYGIVPYKYNYLTILETELDDYYQTNIEVINMGIPFIGPEDYLNLFKEEGLQYEPDMVLCFLHTGNDIHFTPASLTSVYTISFFHFMFKVYPKIKKYYLHSPHEYIDNQKTYEDEYYDEIVCSKQMLFNSYEAKLPSLVKKAVTHLSKMNEICKSKKITFLVIVIPDEIQISPELQKKLISMSSFLEESFSDFSLIQNMINSELERQNVPYFDLTPSFKANNDIPLYKPNDTHWNIAGNKLAEEQIKSFLISTLKIK